MKKRRNGKQAAAVLRLQKKRRVQNTGTRILNLSLILTLKNHYSNKNMRNLTVNNLFIYLTLLNTLKQVCIND